MVNGAVSGCVMILRTSGGRVRCAELLTVRCVSTRKPIGSVIPLELVLMSGENGFRAWIAVGKMSNV